MSRHTAIAQDPMPWKGSSPRVAVALLAGLVTIAVLAVSPKSGAAPRAHGATVDPALARQAAGAPGSTLPVIVREQSPGTDRAEHRFAALGGHITRELPIVRSFAGTVPASSLHALAASPDVAAVWGDAQLKSNMLDIGQYDSWVPNTVWRTAIGATGLSLLGLNGKGVTVALLDTGVSHVADLGNRVLARVDLTQDHDGYDHYGHGTHMAGIIAGDGTLSGGTYQGLAPAANLVSIKTAGWNGSTDVSEVIAGLQWVVDHRATYNIRVLNLSYGTDGTQTYRLDPLDYAVEQVWFSGVMVVVSAGNRGPNAGTINKPGDDPFVLTVGAANVHDVNIGLPLLEADFSSRGPTQDGFAKPDLLAPGISIVSNRAVGSTVDMLHPNARLGNYYFKGTGTSQATAVVSGIAALMFQANSSLTPDKAKAILMSTATPTLVGPKMVDAASALLAAKLIYLGPLANQGLARSTGLGKLDQSRGTFHVYAVCGTASRPQLIVGERDVLCNQWISRSWRAGAWYSSPWVAYTAETLGWNSAAAWDKKGWAGVAWDDSSWDKKGWADAGWTSSSWPGLSLDLSSWG